MEKIKNFLLGNIWLVAVVAIVMGLGWPASGEWLSGYASILLIVLIFFSFADVNYQRLVLHIKDYPRKIVLFFIFHLLTPVLVWLFRSYLPEEVFLGLMLVAVMPVGLNVAYMVENCGGSPAKAKVISLVTNLLSPITVAGLFYLFAGGSVKVEFEVLILTLLKLVIIPLILASIIRKTNLKDWVAKYEKSISLVVLFFLLLALVSPVRDNIVVNWDKSLFLGFLILLFVALNYVVGFLVGSNAKERITFALVMGNKNALLAVVVAISVFGNVVAIPAVIYMLVNNLIVIPSRWICHARIKAKK